MTTWYPALIVGAIGFIFGWWFAGRVDEEDCDD